jgi:hypothetical protein
MALRGRPEYGLCGMAQYIVLTGYSRVRKDINHKHTYGFMYTLFVPNHFIFAETLMRAAATETGTTVASSSNTKAIAGGIGGAVAFVLLVVGAVILRKTCRKLKQKDAAKPDASTLQWKLKDRADALKLGAGASLGRHEPTAVTACSCCPLRSGGTSAHELQRKDRPDALKLGAGANLGRNPPLSQRVAAAPCVQVGRSLLRPRPLLRFRPDSMQRWRWPRRSAR